MRSRKSSWHPDKLKMAFNPKFGIFPYKTIRKSYLRYDWPQMGGPMAYSSGLLLEELGSLQSFICILTLQNQMYSISVVPPLAPVKLFWPYFILEVLKFKGTLCLLFAETQ